MSTTTYTLTVYQADDVTPWFEVSTDPAHDHPYLHVPGEYDQGDVDLLRGKALVGAIEIGIVDPQTGADQSQRFITGLLGIPQGQEGAGHSAVNGRRAKLVRDGSVLVLDGVVAGVRLSESFAGFRFSLRDIRERHRKLALFTRTGTATVLPRGVLNGYGKLPNGEWLIPPTEPLRATFHSHPPNPPVHLGWLEFLLTGLWDGVAGTEDAKVPPELVLTEAMQKAPAVRDARGRYTNVEIWWRSITGDTSWHVLEQPTTGPRRLINTQRAKLKNAGHRDGEEVQGIFSIGAPSGLAAVGVDLPDADEEVDVLIRYIGPASEEYPYHFEGTAGELLRNVYRGDYSERKADGSTLRPVTTHVDEDALLELTDPVRLRLTETPEDSREWIEAAYMQLRSAPGLDLDGVIAPVRSTLPGPSEVLPEITDGNCQAIPGWSHPANDAITVVAVKYHRDFRVAAADDPTGTHSAGDGLASREVRVEHRAPEWVLDLMGEQEHEIDGFLFRALGDTEGEPATGDVTDEAGAALAQQAGFEILDRWVFGGQSSHVALRASDFPTLRAGGWVLDKRSWRPNYRTGKRGGTSLAQALAVRRLNPAWLSARLLDAGPNEQPLAPPTLGTPTVTDEGAVSVPVTVVPSGGEAAVYWAVGTSAPAFDSGAWRLAGRVDATGDVLTPPQPSGATVWIAARGEGLGRRPSDYTAPVDVDIPVTPRVRQVRITWVGGTPTVHWAPNGDAAGVRVYYEVYDLGDSEPDPSTSSDADAADGELDIPVSVTRQRAVVVVVEPYTGWTGSAVTGTAGPSVRVTGTPDADVLVYAECRARIVAADATTVTVQVDADPVHAEVELQALVGATRLSGPIVGTPVPAGSASAEWTFERPAFAAGAGQAVFRAEAPGFQSDDDPLVIPEQGRDTIGLLMRARVLSSDDTQVVVRVAVADPQPGGAISVAYDDAGTGGVSPESPQSIAAGSVTADVDTTGFVDFTIQRPASGAGTGRVTFTATRAGRVAGVDAVDVPEVPPEIPDPIQPPAVEIVYLGSDPNNESLRFQWDDGDGGAGPYQYRWRTSVLGTTGDWGPGAGDGWQDIITQSHDEVVSREAKHPKMIHIEVRYQAQPQIVGRASHVVAPKQPGIDEGDGKVDPNESYHGKTEKPQDLIDKTQFMATTGHATDEMGASDGASVKLIPKGATSVRLKNGEEAAFSDNYQSAPVVIPGPGATMEQRSKWGGLAEADDNGGQGNGNNSAPTSSFIKQAFGADVSAAGLTARLRLQATGTPTAESASFLSPTGISVGQTTGAATPADGDLPAVSDQFRVDFTVFADNDQDEGPVTWRVGLEVQLDGGAWTEVGSETVHASVLPGALSISKDASITATVTGVDGSSDGADRFRLRLKNGNGPPGVSNWTLSVDPGALTWSRDGAASYASATPNGEADAVEFFIVSQG